MTDPTIVAPKYKGEDGVDIELPNDEDHRVRLKGVNRLITEIDDEALTSLLA